MKLDNEANGAKGLLGGLGWINDQQAIVGRMGRKVEDYEMQNIDVDLPRKA